MQLTLLSFFLHPATVPHEHPPSDGQDMLISFLIGAVVVVVTGLALRSRKMQRAAANI